MTNVNLIDFLDVPAATETLIDGGRVLQLTGFAGSGDVVGPASVVDERIAIWDGTSGDLLADGGYTIADLIAMMGGLSDGDYGDIVVSGSGTVMTIDNAVVTAAKSTMFTGLASITVGTSAPGSPGVGDLWIDTN
jgi:hypothetical protein